MFYNISSMQRLKNHTHGQKKNSVISFLPIKCWDGFQPPVTLKRVNQSIQQMTDGEVEFRGSQTPFQMRNLWHCRLHLCVDMMAFYQRYVGRAVLVGQLSNLVKTERSQQLFDGLPRNFTTFMSPESRSPGSGEDIHVHLFWCMICLKMLEKLITPLQSWLHFLFRAK